MRIRINVRARVCIAVASAMLSALSRGQTDQPTALAIGAAAGDCTSALHLGLRSCTAESGAIGPTQGGANAGAANEARSLELRVDDYLVNFGKPPRAAVRALLEPSDENIRAFLADQESTLALTAYVAARMTALKGRGDSNTRQSAAPGFQQLAFGPARLRLFQRPGDRSTEPLLHAMADLSQRMPGLQVGVQIVGPVDSFQLRHEISRIDPLLSVEVTPADQITGPTLPFLRLDDLSRGFSRDFEAVNLSAAQLGQLLVAPRNAGEAHADIAMPESAQ